MDNLKQNFPSASPIRQLREIYTETEPASGTVTYEIWFKDGKQDRADGPAYILRDAATGTVTCEIWSKDGQPFEPSAEEHAAWLQKSGERIASPAVAKPAPAPGRFSALKCDNGFCGE
jgi:hypothetical protein